MKRQIEFVRQQTLSIGVIITEVLELCSKHKKAATIIIIWELWVHSLMFQHLAELKSILELLPFYK